ncbi:hypothetical protein, partial [Salmonella enterica]|uniref:hypothetical protein n=1 Tax=Salmonella enterica TaxID=28901 RepID=UPI0020C23491
DHLVADRAKLRHREVGECRLERDEMVRLLDDRAAIDAILTTGAETARNLAAPVLASAQRAMGLVM